ncbi:PDZ domain-containing protein [Chishuiella sp.]|uniref:PDZ domain-containing protein n=1 Tax=Chishuiella sp. TaxID=1969467 RepID=UPI0028AFF477|nr:PDZ domain-containing protein [Chishuiella sp.]
MKIKVFIFFMLISLISCSQTKEEYDFKYDGYLNFQIKFAKTNTTGNFIFDTGSSELYIDSLFYKKNLNNHKIVKGKISGAGEEIKMIDVITDSVFFNIAKSTSSYFSRISPLLDIKNIAGKKRDGIFGTKFFIDKKIRLDYENQKMFLYDTINSYSFKEYKKMPLIKKGNKFFINMEVIINSVKIKGLFLIDTGNPHTLSINNGIFSEDNLPKNTIYISGGVGGQSVAHVLPASTVKIDNFIFRDVLIEVSIDKLGFLSNTDYKGIIGNKLLDKFDVIIDEQSSTLFLKRNKNFSKEIENKTLGFSFVNRTDIDKGWVVSTLYLNSKAAKNGLKIKDEILSINNTSIKSLDDEKWREEIIKRNDKVINLEILRGDKLYKINTSVENVYDILQ